MQGQGRRRMVPASVRRGWQLSWRHPVYRLGECKRRLLLLHTYNHMYVLIINAVCKDFLRLLIKYFYMHNIKLPFRTSSILILYKYLYIYSYDLLDIYLDVFVVSKHILRFSKLIALPVNNFPLFYNRVYKLSVVQPVYSLILRSKLATGRKQLKTANWRIRNVK